MHSSADPRLQDNTVTLMSLHVPKLIVSSGHYKAPGKAYKT
jgi:hypothetical protein